MKRNIFLIVTISILAITCLFQQIQICKISSQVQNLSDFAENQLELNDSVLDIIDGLLELI